MNAIAHEVKIDNIIIVYQIKEKFIMQILVNDKSIHIVAGLRNIMILILMITSSVL